MISRRLRTVAATSAVIPALLVAGCASDTVDTTTASSTSTVAAESSTTRPAAVSLVDALTTSGATCSGKVCTLDGVEYTVEDDWAGSATLRKKACDEGYVNTAYTVIVAGESWLSGDDSDTYPAVVAAAKKQGVDAKVVDYCPK